MILSPKPGLLQHSVLVTLSLFCAGQAPDQDQGIIHDHNYREHITNDERPYSLNTNIIYLLYYTGDSHEILVLRGQT